MDHTAIREFITLELKYCERCGGLWARETGGLQKRCARCVVEEKLLLSLWRARGAAKGATRVTGRKDIHGEGLPMVARVGALPA